MIYMTPSSAILPCYRHSFGLIETLGSPHNVGGFALWCMDNGRFAKRGLNPDWTEARWLAMLAYYPASERLRCKFSVVPDVPFDAAKTLAAFTHYLPAVVAHGYPPALATQDGMTSADIPWSQIDALFIGGSDYHKLGHEGAALAMEAERRGKWIHVGRVNSIARMQKVWWADSVDGTALAFNSSTNRQLLLTVGVAYCRAKKQTQRML